MLLSSIGFRGWLFLSLLIQCSEVTAEKEREKERKRVKKSEKERKREKERERVNCHQKACPWYQVKEF